MSRANTLAAAAARLATFAAMLRAAGISRPDLSVDERKHHSIIRLGNLHGPGKVRAAGQHQFREIPVLNADPDKPVVVVTGPDTADNIVAAYEHLLDHGNGPGRPLLKPKVGAGRRLITAVEMVLSTPNRPWWDALPEAERERWFHLQGLFVRELVPERAIFSEIDHFDERTPHRHILIVPQEVQKGPGGELLWGVSKSAIVHNSRHGLVELQDRYHAFMAENGFQLERGEPAHLTKARHNKAKQLESLLLRTEAAHDVAADVLDVVDELAAEAARIDARADEAERALADIDAKAGAHLKDVAAFEARKRLEAGTSAATRQDLFLQQVAQKEREESWARERSLQQSEIDVGKSEVAKKQAEIDEQKKRLDHQTAELATARQAMARERELQAQQRAELDKERAAVGAEKEAIARQRKALTDDLIKAELSIFAGRKIGQMLDRIRERERALAGGWDKVHAAIDAVGGIGMAIGKEHQQRLQELRQQANAGASTAVTVTLSDRQKAVAEMERLAKLRREASWDMERRPQ